MLWFLWSFFVLFLVSVFHAKVLSISASSLPMHAAIIPAVSLLRFLPRYILHTHSRTHAHAFIYRQIRHT